MEIDESTSFVLWQDNEDGTVTFTARVVSEELGTYLEKAEGTPDTITAVIPIRFEELLRSITMSNESIEEMEKLVEKAILIPDEY